MVSFIGQNWIYRQIVDFSQDGMLFADRDGIMQYSSGMIVFQYILEAQRSLLSFQDQLAESDETGTCQYISKNI